MSHQETRDQGARQQTLTGELAAAQDATNPSDSVVWCEAVGQSLLKTYAESPQHTENCPTCSPSTC